MNKTWTYLWDAISDTKLIDIHLREWATYIRYLHYREQLRLGQSPEEVVEPAPVDTIATKDASEESRFSKKRYSEVRNGALTEAEL